MNYAVIDTETNGLPDYKLPADDPSQPRLASLALITLHEDLSVSTEYELFVKPDGWTMTEGASKVNGLTDEILKEKGVPVRGVLDLYSSLILEGFKIVAWGAQHDCKVMRGELRRAGMLDLFEQTENICLMRAATNICKLPGKFGFKWPKLIEACAHFKVELNGAHTALGDAHATVEIMRKMKELNAIPAPAVHKAAGKP